MTKRARLWMVGLVAVAFAVFAGANVWWHGTYRGVAYCQGLDHVKDWFSDSTGCGELLPSRLGVIALGMLVMLVCGYFAEKGRKPTARPTGSSTTHDVWYDQAEQLSTTHDVWYDQAEQLSTTHDVWYDPAKQLYWCSRNSCEFKSPSFENACVHRGETSKSRMTASGTRPESLGSSKATQANGASPSAPVAPAPKSPPTVVAQYKNCPDCAEEVREAARKCRFCGYMFTPVASNSL